MSEQTEVSEDLDSEGCLSSIKSSTTERNSNYEIKTKTYPIHSCYTFYVNFTSNLLKHQAKNYLAIAIVI